MLPIILAAVGAYLIGDSVLEDKKSFEHGGMMNEPKYDSAGFTREDDKRIKIYSGNKGKLNEIFNEYKNQKNELTANEVFDNEKMKGKSVFLFVNDDLYDQYVQDEDEEAYADENFGFAEGGYMAKGGKLVGKQKNLDVNKNGKLDAEDFKMLRGEKMAKGGDVQGKTTSKHQDAQRFAKPSGKRWKEKAVKKGVIKRSDLSKSPSKANQEKFPNLVYSEKRSDKSDKNPSYKYTSLAKGGKTNEFADVYNDNVITEKQINLIKTRLNNGKVEETRDILDYIWNNNPKLSAEQNSKGIKFLMNLWKSPTGKERTNNPFGYREQDALETFEYFELAGFYDISRYGQRGGFYVPLYNVIGKDSSFQYYYDGKMNIVG